MNTQTNCQSCRRPADDHLLSYRRGATVLHQESLLQCDVCERYACAECLQVYDIFSGYDFLCHECARGFGGPVPKNTRGH
jgi:LSD1 subclass zinc finger protein